MAKEVLEYEGGISNMLLHGDYKIKRIDKKEDSKKILPTPYTKVNGKTIKEWLQKINEGLDELKEAIIGKFPLHWHVMCDQYSNDYDYYKAKWETANIAEEAANTITAITSMLEAMGIDEDMRQEAQRRVNERNKERGRF